MKNAIYHGIIESSILARMPVRACVRTCVPDRDHPSESACSRAAGPEVWGFRYEWPSVHASNPDHEAMMIQQA
jgi:hypothetical protein